MYGLLLDSVQKFLREKYGEHYWVVIRRRAKLDNHWFVTHEVYSDSVMTNLIDAAAITLSEDRDQVMQMFGEYFVQNIGRYGYARLLRVLGRDLRDFLNGLDDLHEYLRFSYPKMRAPSFFCEQETPEGVIMHYTTKRQGYLPYVVGQLHAVGLIYQKELEITVIKEDKSLEGYHVMLHLKFDNSEMLREHRDSLCFKEFEISGPTFLNVFPFAVVFDETSSILALGPKLRDVLLNVKGKTLDQVFEPERPAHVLLQWDSVSQYTSVCLCLLCTLCNVASNFQINNFHQILYTNMSTMFHTYVRSIRYM